MRDANHDIANTGGGGHSATVSVVVPVHNEAKVLGRTLESLLNQDYSGACVQVIAALNGCTDDSRRIADAFGVTVIESSRCGISFGRNLGASMAKGEILVFVDADTTLPPCAVGMIVSAMRPYPAAVLGVRGRPERGGPVVRAVFCIANWYTCYKRVSPPGGVTAVHHDIFTRLNGFDEKLPQGTNTDFILRARAVGAHYLCPWSFRSVTSIRRFEKVGIVEQMLAWRRNHRDIELGLRDRVEARDYDNVR